MTDHPSLGRGAGGMRDNRVHVGRVIFIAGLGLGMLIGLLSSHWHTAETMPPVWVLCVVIAVSAMWSWFVLAKFERDEAKREQVG